jgi:hypothetical protein
VGILTFGGRTVADRSPDLLVSCSSPGDPVHKESTDARMSSRNYSSTGLQFLSR